jgi:hypothetical protein
MQARVESNKLHLEPLQHSAGFHVIVNVENYDGSRSLAPNSPAPNQRMAYQLEHILGETVERVKQIEAELNAGCWVLLESRCARKHLVNAGFVER